MKNRINSETMQNSNQEVQITMCHDRGPQLFGHCAAAALLPNYIEPRRGDAEERAYKLSLCEHEGTQITTAI